MELAQIVFSGILVTATVFYVVYTYKLVQEARKTREIGLRPSIIMYLDFAEASPTNRFLNIENVGKGVAKNVKFELMKDLEYPSKYDLLLKDREFLQRIYGYFPPGYKARHYIFNFSNNPEEKKNDSIHIKCSYQDVFDKKQEEVFVLNFKDGFAAGKLTPPDTYIGRISYRLEKIEKLMEKFLKRESQV